MTKKNIIFFLFLKVLNMYMSPNYHFKKLKNVSDN